MTYPPQPGQPDPYGQQPQSGGFPQQGGWDPNQQQQPYPTQQYPQHGWGDPNAQQQAWADPNAQQYGQQAWDPNQGGQMSGWDPATGGYSQGFGGPPAPPKKSRTGMWIAIGAAVVVVLAAVGITGFVAPGFFLSKDEGTVAAPPSSSASAQPSAPKSTPKKSTTPSDKPSGSGEGVAVIKNFVAKLNSGDTAGAIQLGCADKRELLTQSLDLIKPPFQLEAAGGSDGDFMAQAEVGGTAGGKNVDGFIMATNIDGSGFCVSLMLVS
jgi:hypothetical protein